MSTGLPATELLDTIAGLPLHPLIVHFAVVLLPLSAVALIAIIVVPRWRATFGWLTLGGLTVGTGAALAAASSGEALAERVGEPERHAQLGEATEIVAVILLVVAAIWFLLQRRSAKRTDESPRVLGSGLQLLAALATLGLAVAALGLSVAVGHSGAQAVWEGRLGSSTAEGSGDGEATATTPAAASTTNAAQPTAAATPTDASGAITMADVQAHATASDCWSVVDGNVYDLTSWVNQHPGGTGVITSMCGVDASAAFRDQHDNQGEPNQFLASFELGPLS